MDTFHAPDGSSVLLDHCLDGADAARFEHRTRLRLALNLAHLHIRVDPLLTPSEHLGLETDGAARRFRHRLPDLRPCMTHASSSSAMPQLQGFQDGHERVGRR